MTTSMAIIVLQQATCIFLKEMVMTTTQMFVHWDIVVGEEHNVMLISKVFLLLEVEYLHVTQWRQCLMMIWIKITFATKQTTTI
jgi:hypothetical protein